MFLKSDRAVTATFSRFSNSYLYCISDIVLNRIVYGGYFKVNFLKNTYIFYSLELS